MPWSSLKFAWGPLLWTCVLAADGEFACKKTAEKNGQRCTTPEVDDIVPLRGQEDSDDTAILLQYGSASVMELDPRTFESEIWLDDNSTFNSFISDSGSYQNFPFLDKIFGKEEPPEKNASKNVETLRHQMKLKLNNEGDLGAFVSSLVCNGGLLVMMVLTFCLLARWYPIVYSNNSRTGIADPVPAGFFGWVSASYNLDFEHIEKAAGLDAAMFIEFISFAIKLCVAIAVPKCLILCPLHYWYGGEAKATNDHLTEIGIGNLHDGSWVFWVHAGMVWWVVLVAMYLVHSNQDTFVKRRFEWIARMPHPRDTTVLVEGIPEEYCSDAALKAYFCKLFSEDLVESAYVIKYTQPLQKQLENYGAAGDNLSAAENEWQKAGGAQEQRPKCRDHTARLVDKIDYYKTIKCEAAQQVEAERQRIQQQCGRIYTNTGFVTFTRRREAAIAVYLKVEADDMIFMMSTPPDPADVIYSDFMSAGSWLATMDFLGHASIIALFFGFTPIILGISSLLNEEFLVRAFPVLGDIMTKFPMFEATLKGVLASAALTLMMSFLPTIFCLIFTTFFQLKAGQWVQARLQIWYFWFQVIFVMLIPAVGASLMDTIMTIIDHPLSIVSILAYRLPQSTHFYMNYIVMQWMTHGMVLTRYMNLIKFQAFSAMFTVDRAKELSEPEDQDYYGMGGRTARFSLVLSICLVYCSLAPLIAVLAGINFAMCRIIYGYLLVFAETPKPDLGGVFWVAQLKQVQIILFAYVMLMIGVLSQRAATMGPVYVVLPSLFFLFKSFIRFHTAYDWEFLCFSQLVSYEGHELSTSKQDKATRNTYAQPELSTPKIADEDLKAPNSQ